MKPLRKIYCRSFQTVLKLSIPFLPYRRPKMIGSLRKLPDILKRKKKKRVLIVTDPGIRGLGLLIPLERALSRADISYYIYEGTVANPTTTNIYEAVEMYFSNDCQAIIGFGGGSSLDCAKGVAVRIAKPGTSLSRLAGILKVHTRLPLLIAIPTTADTGSETTIAAVITDAQTRHKYAINDFPLIPRYAILDPRLTLSLLPSVTASTGMDALTHAVEAYIGNSTTPETRKLAMKAVKLIFQNLDTAVSDGSNITARKNMLHASFYAGCAFIDAIRDMKKRYGIGDTIPELRREDIPRLARYADHEANPLYPVPVLMDAAELEQFYYMLLEN